VEILIHTGTGAEVQRFIVADAVRIPGTTGDKVFTKGSQRPLDIGPDHFLATATVNDNWNGMNPATHKRGIEVVTINTGAKTVVVDLPIIPKTAQEISDDKDSEVASEMNRKFIKAVVGWVAPLVGKTIPEAKAEIKAIYKALA